MEAVRIMVKKCKKLDEIGRKGAGTFGDRNGTGRGQEDDGKLDAKVQVHLQREDKIKMKKMKEEIRKVF